MISENDQVGKTRFEFIQDKWIGGDVAGELFKVNYPHNYRQIVEQNVTNRNLSIAESISIKTLQNYASNKPSK